MYTQHSFSPLISGPPCLLRLRIRPPNDDDEDDRFVFSASPVPGFPLRIRIRRTIVKGKTPTKKKRGKGTVKKCLLSIARARGIEEQSLQLRDTTITASLKGTLSPLSDGIEETVTDMFKKQAAVIGTIRRLTSVLLNQVADNAQSETWFRALTEFKFVRAIAASVWGNPFL